MIRQNRAVMPRRRRRTARDPLVDRSGPFLHQSQFCIDHRHRARFCQLHPRLPRPVRVRRG
uniref:Uncharacterized protein n=1 Tax=Arundo donax TaxID=35708 RepID=A0A0A9ELE2_ARUDO